MSVAGTPCGQWECRRRRAARWDHGDDFACPLDMARAGAPAKLGRTPLDYRMMDLVERFRALAKQDTTHAFLNEVEDLIAEITLMRYEIAELRKRLEGGPDDNVIPFPPR